MPILLGSVGQTNRDTAVSIDICSLPFLAFFDDTVLGILRCILHAANAFGIGNYLASLLVLETGQGNANHGLEGVCCVVSLRYTLAKGHSAQHSEYLGRNLVSDHDRECVSPPRSVGAACGHLLKTVSSSCRRLTDRIM